MQKWEKPKCTVLMKREKNNLQRPNRMVRLPWKKRYQKAAEEESQIMQVRWSVMNLYGVCLLMHCKKLYKGSLISVYRRGRWNRAQWVTLICSPCEARAAPQLIRHSWMYILQDYVLFFHDMTWSPGWLLSLDPDTRHESEWRKPMIHHMDFFLKSSYVLH